MVKVPFFYTKSLFTFAFQVANKTPSSTEKPIVMLKRTLLTVFALWTVAANALPGPNYTLTSTKPTTSLGDDGTITIKGATKNTAYKVNYDYVSAYYYDTKKSDNTSTITADAAGDIVITNLEAGTYNNFSIDGTPVACNPNSVQLADETSLIASSKHVSWNISIFEAMNGVFDDNPTNFTEYYLAIGIPVNRKAGIPSNSGNKFWYKPNTPSRFIWLRNLFLQGDYTPNVGSLPAAYHDTVKNPIRYVNPLDALKYSNARLIGNLNLLTFVVPEFKSMGDLGHVYLDAVAGVANTNISDSNKGPSFFAKSFIYGGSLRVKAKNLRVAGNPVPLGFEFGAQILWINVFSNEVNGLMNDQYSNRLYTSILSPSNANKPFTVPMQPYTHLDMLLYYYTGKSNDTLNSSNFYFHASLYTNFKNPNTGTPNYVNNYLQFQVGYSLSIDKLINTVKGGK